MKKASNLLFYLLVGYVLPLLKKPDLLVHWQILLLMFAATVIVLTQPTLDLAEARKNKSTDRFTMLWITMLALPSIIAPIIEWAYFKPQAQILHQIPQEPDVLATMFAVGDIPLPNGWIVLGIVTIIGGLALRVWAIEVLGKAFTSTVQIVPEHALVTSGPYRFVRHPSYLGAYLAFLGSAILLQSWIGLLIAALCMAIAYLIRIPAEERVLENNFGDVWRDYRENSWRMIPGVW